MRYSAPKSSAVLFADVRTASSGVFDGITSIVAVRRLRWGSLARSGNLGENQAYSFGLPGRDWRQWSGYSGRICALESSKMYYFKRGVGRGDEGGNVEQRDRQAEDVGSFLASGVHA